MSSCRTVRKAMRLWQVQSRTGPSAWRTWAPCSFLIACSHAQQQAQQARHRPRPAQRKLVHRTMAQQRTPPVVREVLRQVLVHPILRVMLLRATSTTAESALAVLNQSLSELLQVMNRTMRATCPCLGLRSCGGAARPTSSCAAFARPPWRWLCQKQARTRAWLHSCETWRPPAQSSALFS